VGGFKHLVRVQSFEKAMGHALLSVKCCCFEWKLWKSHATLN